MKDFDKLSQTPQNLSSSNSENGQPSVHSTSSSMDSPFPLKRHHHHNNNHPHPHPPPPPQPKLSAGEAQFRILCPSLKAGGVIGKGGAVIRQLREDTGARIRIIDDFATSHCDERVILISAASTPNPNPSPNCATRGAEERENDGNCSVAQAAVIKVFQRILKVDEERGEINNSNNNNNSGISGNNNNNNDKINNSNNNESEENVVCRMLVGGNQVGSVLGRGGKIVESIRQDSGAQVRILPRDSVPACASPGDELIQIAGNFQAVKKALLLVTSCLQEHPRSETFQGANITSQTDSFPHRGSHAIDHHSRGFLTSSACENFGPNHRLVPEEDVVFKLLCPVERTGNLIGKGGFFVRGIQNETGASIKINEAVASNSDERVVVISARESIDLKISPAQDAAIRVHNRIAEIGFEPGAPVVARLLVPSQQIGCLMGKGGLIINEMRRSTGAGIRIFGRDQGPKLSTSNDEVVQVIGNIQSVQDALFQITSRIRENIFPSMQHLFQESSSSYSNSFSELPSPSFRPKHDQVSPGHYHSPIGLAHSYDNRSVSQGSANFSAFAHGTERTGGANSEQDRHHFGGDRVPFVPERPPSPNSWYPQAVNNGHPGIYSDAGVGPSGVVTNNSQSGQMQKTSVEVVVPQILLPHVYGENKTNISHITQFSGADVAVYDPKPGATEGRVVISGTPCQLHTAQSLVHAFILCGQAF